MKTRKKSDFLKEHPQTSEEFEFEKVEKTRSKMNPPISFNSKMSMRIRSRENHEIVLYERSHKLETHKNPHTYTHTQAHIHTRMRAHTHTHTGVP
jgi:hypothetical protein